MRRRISYVGVCVLFSLVFAIAFHTAAVPAAVVCFVFSVVCFVLDHFGKKTRVFSLCAMVMCISILAYCGVVKYYVEPIVSEFDGETVEFSGMITSKPFTENGYTHFTVRTDTVNGVKKHLNIYVSTSYTTTAHTYDYISARTTLSGLFDYGYGYESYYAARHIFLSTYINTYYGGYYSVSENDSRPFYAVFSDVREYISSQFRKYLPYDEASVCTAVLTGEKDYLRDEVYSVFKNLGVSHILVVSGLHLSIVAAALGYITNRFPKNRFGRITSSLFRIAGITVFAAMTGFGFSITRAWLMSVIMAAAGFMDKNRFHYEIRSEMSATSMDSLGIAALILCIDPLSAGDIGMLWSFSCTLSIIMFSERTESFLKRSFKLRLELRNVFTAAVAVSASAFVGSLPFVIFATGSFSPYTIIVNLLTVPITGFIIIMGGIAVVVSLMHLGSAAGLLMKSVCILVKYLIWITGEFSKLPFSSVGTSHAYLYVWFFFTLAIFTVFEIRRKKRLNEIEYKALFEPDKDLLRKIRKNDIKFVYTNLFLVSAVVLLLGYCVDFCLNYGDITVSVLDVGSGMTVTVKKDDRVVLLDSYGEKYQYSTIKNELSNYNEITCLVDITPYKSEYNYNRKIIHDFSVGKMIVYGDYIYNEKYLYQRYMGNDVSRMTDDYSLEFFGDSVLDVRNAYYNSWQYLTVYGTGILICPQNSDFSTVPQSFLNPDIVVMNNIPDGFDISRDVYILVSDYGEECLETIRALEEQGYAVDATNGEGRIDFVFSKDGYISLEREYTGGVTRYADN